MTYYADSDARPYSIADLAAHAADVGRVLHLGGATIELPRPRRALLPNGVIPDGALALVAGLDSYGD